MIRSVRYAPCTLGDRCYDSHNDEGLHPYPRSVAEIIGMERTSMFHPQPQYTPDDMLVWLRLQHPNGIEIGPQDDVVGFPPTAPAGFWVKHPTPGGTVSHIAPSLHGALEMAVKLVAKNQGEE